MPQTKRNNHIIVILTHLSTSFKLSPELEKKIYDIGQLPYCPPEKCNPAQFKKLIQISYVQILRAVKSGSPIILLDQTPISLQLLKEMHEGKRKPDTSAWTILSFFHEDEALKNTDILVMPDTPIDPQILLREKHKDLERMSEYPFIEKYLIPYGYEITSELIEELSEKKEK